MNKISKKTIVASLLIGTLSGCAALVPDSMIKAAHQEMDTNHDGYVDYNEYLKSSSKEDTAKEAQEKGMTEEEYLKWDFNRADGDGNGKVTVQEMLELFQKEF